MHKLPLRGTEVCVCVGTLVIRSLHIAFHLTLPQALPFSKGPVHKSWGMLSGHFCAPGSPT